MSVFRELIDKKVLKILELLLKNKSKYFHLKKISKEAKVPIASTYRIINFLVSINIVDQTNIDKMKIYKIADNEKTKELHVIFRGKK